MRFILFSNFNKRMLPFSFGQLLFCQLLAVIVNCDYLFVNTGSGTVRGVEEKTFLSNKAYISFKGIPYAKPPVGKLRFRVPVRIAPWQKTLYANKYGNSCLVLAQSQLFPLNSTQSEDCLYLNIFTPVIGLKKKDAKKAVMFFIHGGAFTEGDGTDGAYGPDFIIEHDVLLVTHNYRLGPWGFANFEEPGFTGNMGFKDQQLALEWIKKNIEHFGGDPNLITIFGESAGGVSVHLQMLSDRSKKCIRRAIMMSGVAFTYFAHYKENNHIELLKNVFELDKNSTGRDVLKFMINAPTDLILQKAPVINLPLGLVELFWSAVVEDERIAESPFLTQNPRDILRRTKNHIDVMIGCTSAEYLAFLNPADRYNWVEQMKTFSNIGMPFHGLTLQPESPRYREAQLLAGKFYFGHKKIEANLENLNQFVQMNSDINFQYPTYEAMVMHSEGGANIFCYQNNLQLKLNFIKMNFQKLFGTAHFEDLLYLFRSGKYSYLYDEVMANQDDVTNQETLNAFYFVPKMFTDYAKTGSVGNLKKFRLGAANCIQIVNDGLRAISVPRKEAIKLWGEIYNKLKPWIDDQF